MLTVVLAGFAVLSVIYSLATKLRYGPDEPAHFIYIRALATKLAPPPIAHTETRSIDSEATHEGHQPPLYYAIMAVPYAALDAAGASTDTIWRVLRLLGTLIGLAWIYFVYMLAREFLESEEYALATTAFVALIPNAPYTAGVVNNDVLIAALFTWAMVPILAFFKTGVLSVRSSAMLGLAMGLAILTKAQGLVLVPVFLLAALLVWRRANYANSRAVLRSVWPALGIALVVAGWWFVRSWLCYGTLMPQSLHNPVLTRGGMAALVFLPELAVKLVWLSTGSLYGYFWTPFWLVQPFLDWPAYFYPLLAAGIVTVVGLIIRLRRGGVDCRSLALLVFTAVLTYLLWLRYWLVVDKMTNLQGRLLLPVAAVVAITWVLGLDGFLKSRRAKTAGLVAGVVIMLAANAAVIACAVAFYATGR